MPTSGSPSPCSTTVGIYDDDIRLAGEILPRWRNLAGSDEAIAPMSQFVRERQIGRLHVVGSNDTTAPVIEASYRRFLAVLDNCIVGGPFLFGARPSSADFGLYGQLTQLAAFDPTPARLTEADRAASARLGAIGGRSFGPGTARGRLDRPR